MAPVAGSVYAYAYTTLGEIFAWIIGWDLILEYSMGTAAVASSWSNYLNELLVSVSKFLPHTHWEIPSFLLNDPFTEVEGLSGRPWLNLPSVLIMVLVTVILVRGIKESTRTNALLVMIKVSVVCFVVAIGIGYVNPSNWTSIPVDQRGVAPGARRHGPGEEGACQNGGKAAGSDDKAAADRVAALTKALTAQYRLQWVHHEVDRLREGPPDLGKRRAERGSWPPQQAAAPLLAKDAQARAMVEKLLPAMREEGVSKEMESWGLLGSMGLNRWLVPIDDATRTPFMPYGLSGIMLGASIVFFAFIGFDSISTHAEEARRPQRDVPIGIITSLVVCTVLYMAVAAVITGMVHYPKIDTHAAIAVAFGQRAEQTGSPLLRAATVLISAGGLAGMTSVLLVLFLSQARVFMAMARDGLLPGIFGEVHPRFRTPHIATMATGGVICLVAALAPIRRLAKMVNIGTLLAFIMVCAAVMILRVERPDAHASLPLSRLVDRRPAGHPRQPGVDAVSAAVDLDSPRRLAGNRPGDLFPLQPPPQPPCPALVARAPTPARRRRASGGGDGIRGRLALL